MSIAVLVLVAGMMLPAHGRKRRSEPTVRCPWEEAGPHSIRYGYRKLWIDGELWRVSQESSEYRGPTRPGTDRYFRKALHACGWSDEEIEKSFDRWTTGQLISVVGIPLLAFPPAGVPAEIVGNIWRPLGKSRMQDRIDDQLWVPVDSREMKRLARVHRMAIEDGPQAALDLAERSRAPGWLAMEWTYAALLESKSRSLDANLAAWESVGRMLRGAQVTPQVHLAWTKMRDSAYQKVESRDWTAVESSRRSIDSLAAYVQRHPTGAHIQEAREDLRRLVRANALASLPSPWSERDAIAFVSSFPEVSAERNAVEAHLLSLARSRGRWNSHLQALAGRCEGNARQYCIIAWDAYFGATVDVANPDSVMAWIQDNPGAPNISRIHGLYFRSFVSGGTEALLSDYVSRQPEGSYTLEAWDELLERFYGPGSGRTVADYRLAYPSAPNIRAAERREAKRLASVKRCVVGALVEEACSELAGSYVKSIVDSESSWIWKSLGALGGWKLDSMCADLGDEIKGAYRRPESLEVAQDLQSATGYLLQALGSRGSVRGVGYSTTTDDGQVAVEALGYSLSIADLAYCIDR